MRLVFSREAHSSGAPAFDPATAPLLARKVLANGGERPGLDTAARLMKGYTAH